jgi:SPP1 gp7 family putative phage head morphogenesis protein
MRLTGKMGLIENIGNLFRGKKLSEGPGTLPGMSAGSQPQIMNTATSINTAVNQVQPTYLPPLPTTDGQFPRYDGPPVEGYGVTGWQKFGGFSAEEYLAILQGRNGVQIFDEMFRSDSQVYTATMRTFNKIKNAHFYVKAPDKTPEAKKRAEKLNYCLFKAPIKVWQDNLNDILSHLIYAFSVLEPSFRQEENRKYGNIWCVNSYGWRNPKTIWQWYTFKDTLQSIRQISWGDDFRYVNIPGQAYCTISRPDGTKETVPWSELIVFTHLRFGNNMEGISPLRPMYRPFLIKDKMHKINIVGAENNARGLRVYSVADAFLGTDKDKQLDKINEKATKSNIPMVKISKDSMDFKFFETKYDSNALQQSIRMLDADISKVTQTESSELGQSAHGSRSMGQTKESGHDESCKPVADYICQKLNPLVKFLEICNEGEQDEYCELAVEGIDAKPTLEDAQKLQVLISAGVVDPNDPEIREYVAEHFDLPIIDRGDDKGEAEPDLPPIVPPQGAAPAPAQGQPKKEQTQRPQKPPKPKQAHEHTHGRRLSEFVPRRTLTQWESKINFAEINNDFNNLDAKYVSEIRNSVKNFLIPKYKMALLAALRGSRNKHKDIQSVEFGKKSKVKEIITGLLMDSVTLGRTQAKNELNNKMASGGAVKFAERGDMPAGVYGWVKANAEYATDTLYGDLTKKAETTALTSLDNGRSDDEVAHDVTETLDDFIDSDVSLGGGIAVNKAYNEGRWSAFEEASENIQGFQYSAILDASTCDLCAELDGNTFEIDDVDSDEYNPPQHANCRCIIIPITTNEAAPDEWNGLDEAVDESDDPAALNKMKTLSEVVRRWFGMPKLVEHIEKPNVPQVEVKKPEPKSKEVKDNAGK